MIESAWNILLYAVVFIGVIYLAGGLGWVCNCLFLRLMGDVGYRAVFVTSMIGTPIHELAHAIACIIFGHKIDGIKLLSFDPENPVLGYVKHRYDKHSIYQRIGNFFIGLAPIYGGCAVLLLGLFLLPGGCQGVVQAFSLQESIAVENFFPELSVSLLGFYQYFFSLESVGYWGWWVYLVIGLCIALHINISKEDLKGSLSGLLFVLIVISLFNLICGLISMPFLHQCNAYVIAYAAFMCVFLSLAVMFSFILVFIALLCFAVRRIVLAVKQRKGSIS